MTKRVVSLMGVAAVATMVILAGCSSGPGAAPADEDHAAAIAGTWMSQALDRRVPLDLMDPTNLTAVMTTVTVEIVAGDMANMGTFAIASTDTVAGLLVSGVSVSGTIVVDASEIVT